MSSTAKRISEDRDCPLEKKPKVEIENLTSSTSAENSREEEKLPKERLRVPKNKREPKEVELLPDIFNNMMPSKIGFHIKDGVRFLDPYWSAFGSYAKGRWIGREVTEVFATEFLSHNKYYIKAAVRMGRLFINGKQMTNPAYRFRSSDRVIHLGHRHEHPILAEPAIRVIAETDKYLVVDKPPSMPVHACGQYKIHSVVGLLRTLYKIDGLKVCHRLDRTTSGVLIFAKDHVTDLAFKGHIDGGRNVSKEYICKVEGIFSDEELVCEAPIGVLSVMMGIQYVSKEGKSSYSRFRRLSVNEAENTSLVLCKIETGRTHQIRVHLQYLGYPIVNDYFYNDAVWGPEKGKLANYGKPFEELREMVQNRHKSSLWIETAAPDYEERLKSIAENELQEVDEIDLNNLRLDEMPTYDAICMGCNVTKRVPTLNHFRMMLHCWRYKGEDWEFEAPLPDWAAELRKDGEIEKPTRPLKIPSAADSEQIIIPSGGATTTDVSATELIDTAVTSSQSILNNNNAVERPKTAAQCSP